MKSDLQTIDASTEEDATPQAASGYLILNPGGFEDTATSGKTALMIAVLANNSRMVGHMLDNGFDPNQQDDVGFTALMYAAKLGSLELCQQLVHGGGNIWITSMQNETAFQIAEGAGHAEVSSFLRDFDAVGSSTAEVSLLAECLADGYVIAVRLRDNTILPVIAVAAENTEVIVISEGGDDRKVPVEDCQEELTVDTADFSSRFNAQQIARLKVA